MKRNLVFSITGALCLASVVFMFGCKDGGGTSRLPGSTGKTNEIVLVTSDNIGIHHPMVDTVKAFFTQSDIQLPQPEPLYAMPIVAEKDLANQVSIQRQHNVLIVSLDPTIEHSSVSSKKDVMAQPQMVVRFNVNSDTAFYRLFEQNKNAILLLFDHNELLRARNLTDFGKSIGLSEDIFKQFDIRMTIPAGFTISQKDVDFLWFSQRSHRKNQDMIASIMIWQRPYVNELQFSTDSLIESRNAVAKKYIPGPSAGSYMKTATSFIRPVSDVVSNYPVDFTIEMRGLWETQGDFMGGPFLSYTFVHPTTGKLVAIEAFLYHPNNPKRALLRQLQSIITNVEFPKD